MKLPSTSPTRTAPIGPRNGNVGNSQRAGSAVDASDIGIIFGVSREHERNDLGFALKAFGEQRPNGAVDLRLVRISRSLGRPSRLINPPGIRPPA